MSRSIRTALPAGLLLWLLAAPLPAQTPVPVTAGTTYVATEYAADGEIAERTITLDGHRTYVDSSKYRLHYSVIREIIA